MGIIDPDSNESIRQQQANNEVQEDGFIFNLFAAGLGAIAIGAGIFKGRGKNLIGELLHYANHPGAAFSRVKSAANQGATTPSSSLSAGIRSILDGFVSAKDPRKLHIGDVDLIREASQAQDVLTALNSGEVRDILTQRLRQSIHARFSDPKVSSFFDHNLERITAGEVLRRQDEWVNRIGKNQFEKLQSLKKANLIADDLVLSRRIFKDKQGKVLDARIGISRLIDKVTKHVDPFGQGKVLRSIAGTTRKYGILPGEQAGEGLRFFVAGDIDIVYRNKGVLSTKTVATNRKLLYGIGDPLKTIRSVRHGSASIADPAGGFLSKVQRATGVGTAYSNRPALIKRLITNPIRRARALSSGKGVLYKKAYVHEGSKEVASRTSLGAIMPEAFTDLGAPVKVAGGGKAVDYTQLSFFKKMQVLLGMSKDYEVVTRQGLADALTKNRKLNINDMVVPLKTGGIKHTDRVFQKGTAPKGSIFVQKPVLTTLGDLNDSPRAAFYDINAGLLSQVGDVASYMAYRLNSLASESLLGIGFKPAKTAIGNWARVAAIPLAYETLKEGIGYADYLSEDLTGFSPIKALATAYTKLRVGQQKLREVTGIQQGLTSLEENFPGSVNSELGYLARHAAPVGLFGMLFGRTGFKKAALAAGTLFGLIGGPNPTQTSADLQAEYAGEKKVAIKRSAFWGMGYQPFFGNDIAYYDYSWYHKLQTDYRTKAIYGSRSEYYKKYSNVGGIPLPTPTNLFGIRNFANLYGIEEKHYLDRPYQTTAGMFDEFPIVGPLLSATVGELIKPRKQMHVSDLYGIPAVGPTVVDRYLPPSAASRLGIADIPAFAQAYKSADDISVKIREQAAIASEPLGVYKFAMGFFGVDTSAIGENQAASATAIASRAREYYEFNIGGLFGQTEFARRFYLSELGRASKQRTLINPIRNTMPTWLPGSESEFYADRTYYLNMHQGDPYAQLDEGEARLPGTGYEALNPLHSGTAGVYSSVDRFLILADVAPYSNAYLKYKNEVLRMRDGLTPYWQSRVTNAMEQRDTIVKQLHAYPRYNNQEALADLNEQTKDSTIYQGARRAWDFITHDILAEIPYVGSKIAPFRDPLERYLREEVYGESFANWNRPYESIIRPAMYDMARANPFMGAVKGAAIGYLLNNTPIGFINPFPGLRGSGTIPALAAAGAGLSVLRSSLYGDNFMPAHKQEEIEAAEYMDRQIYYKHRAYQELAEAKGDTALAAAYRRLADKTMSGARTERQMRSAMTRGDRKYFDTFLNYPVSERAKLLESLPTYYAETLRRSWEKDYRTVEENDTATLKYLNEVGSEPADSLLWHPSVPAAAMKIKMIDAGIGSVSHDIHNFGLYESQRIETEMRFPSVHSLGRPGLRVPDYNAFKYQVQSYLRGLNPFSYGGTRFNIKEMNHSSYNPKYVMTSEVDRQDQVFAYMNDILR